MVSRDTNYRWRFIVLNISFESSGSESCENWYWCDAEGRKHQNITSAFSRSTNPQSQVTTNTSCHVSIVGLCENKGRAERVWVSLTRTFTGSAQRELAYHYCKCWDVRRILPLGSSQFHNHKYFTSGPHADGKSLENTLCWYGIISPSGRSGARQRGSLLRTAGPLLQVKLQNTDCCWVWCIYRTSGWDSFFTASSQTPAMQCFIGIYSHCCNRILSSFQNVE